MKFERHSLGNLRNAVLLSVGFVLAAVIAACNSTTTPPPSPPPQVTTSVSIDGGNVVLASVHQTANLTATVKVPSGESAEVTWTSDDSSVATVTSTGPAAATVEGIGQGIAKITATSKYDGSKTDSIAVSVALPAPDLSNVYVDASAKDGGNGSATYPFRTIAEGVSAVALGGTVHVAAGTYPEKLYIDKSLTLQGAGEGSTVIVANGDATGDYSAAALIGVDVNGFTLEDFTLRLVAPGPTGAGIDIFQTKGTPSSNITIQRVTVEQENTTTDPAGIYLVGTQNVLIDHVTLTASPSTSGAGIVLREGSNISVSNAVTSGHDGYAGVLIYPDGAAMNTIGVQGTFGEINKLQVRYDHGGSVTNLSAPQFGYVVRNADAGFASGGNWFYKTSESSAILDALFNFGSVWQQSFIQPTAPGDQATLQNVFIVGSADGAPYGYTYSRACSVQVAIDHAQPNATVQLLTGPLPTFDGQVNVSVAGLTLHGSGAGATITTLSSATAPVLTVAANDLAVTGVAVSSSDASHAGVLVGTATGFSITGSNLLSPIAMNNQGGNAVTATQNWWGDASGPTISTNPAGSGNVLIDPSGNVGYTPFTGTPH